LSIEEAHVILFLFLLAQTASPTQTDRGEALYMDAANGCASCHALKGKGTAVGPDLKDMARLSPKGIAVAIRSTVTQYVQNFKLKTGESFAGYSAKLDDATVTVWDLSKNPPEAHKVAKGDFTATPNQNWKHPPSAQKWTDEQMADVVAYVRYAGANIRTPVSPADIR
jgi:mono/diheme cytochrome c family protein